MFACILITILFLPAALLPSALHTFFSFGELNEMGVYLEDAEITNVTPGNEFATLHVCVCN